DLTEYFRSMGVQARYLHSDIDTLERMALINALRRKEFDVLVGINLLREGLDIPEVSLVAILDADKEGFLRSAGSLIQTFGRAARNSRGRVIMYADGITASMRAAMDETERRRKRQADFNEEHGITPLTIRKDVDTPFDSLFAPETQSAAKKRGRRVSQESVRPKAAEMPPMSAEEIGAQIQKLEREMRDAARELEFERAALLRDTIRDLREQLIQV
ncbi:MAG: UvrB/UvrC motif-containing protein, partial [Deltaproteobacteria bacterium]|nr:UvrB/UvrC motif-containing protein [Deltaproteobacteria bacterium]